MPTAEGPEGMTLLTDGRRMPVASFRWPRRGRRACRRPLPARARHATRPGRPAGRARPARLPADHARRTGRAALIGAGCTLTRAATDMERDLRGADSGRGAARRVGADPARLGRRPGGGAGRGLRSGAPDGRADRVGRLRGLLEDDRGLLLLPGASARLRGPDWRSAGQVFTVGPVPWGSTPMSWVLDLAVTPRAQGRGLGAALLAYAMRGTLDAGLTTAGLTVTDGNPPGASTTGWASGRSCGIRRCAPRSRPPRR